MAVDILPNTIIYDGLSAKGLVEFVESLRERIEDLEIELKAVRLIAEEGSGTAGDAVWRVEDLKNDLEEKGLIP